MLKYGRDYVQQLMAAYEERIREQQERSLRRKAELLGFDLVPQGAAAPPGRGIAGGRGPAAGYQPSQPEPPHHPAERAGGQGELRQWRGTAYSLSIWLLGIDPKTIRQGEADLKDLPDVLPEDVRKKGAAEKGK